MRLWFRLSAAALVALIACATGAHAGVLTQEALAGKWAVNAGTCSNDKSEFLIFKKNGGLESIRDGRLEAVGFWKLNDQDIAMNVLASPAFFHDDLKELEGKYYAFDIALATYDVADDRFEGVGVLGEEIRRGRFVRCKS